MSITTLLILYNANASLLGKVNYSYRKITCSKSDDPACAACDITHGGLHLDETAAWKEAKAELQGQGVEVRQLHRDELEGEVKEYVKGKGLAYPMVLRHLGEGMGLEVVMDNKELAALSGDAAKFVDALKSKDVLSEAKTSNM